jgi:hypothetical protein
MLFEFLEDMELDNIRVRAPTDVVLLCGGRMTNALGDPPISIRDAFYKIPETPIPQGADLIRAEDTSAFFVKSAMYNDYLQFENDLAQICELILLFCESESSFAELGAFASHEEIASKTLVVVQDQYFNDETSYIKLGPLQSLINRNSTSVFTINDGDIGINGKNYSGIKLTTLKERLKSPIEKRLETLKEHTRLNVAREGHIIKMIVGFLQEFGALSRDEILLSLQHVGINIDNDRLSGYLLCAAAVGWAKEARKGDRVFCFANPKAQNDAAQISLSGVQLPKNVKRRRAVIRDYWDEHDNDRFRSIAEYDGIAK